MLHKILIPLSMLVIVGLLVVIVGCNSIDDPKQPVAPSSGVSETAPICIDFPATLPLGITVQHVKQSLVAKTDVPLDMLVPEALEVLGSSYAPEEYYIDSLGLHWGHPKRIAEPTALGDCYHAYGLSIVGGLHIVYWFSYRPPSYNAYMAWIPIYAQPWGSNGILVQKRDICWICGCNPLCALIWTWICAK